MKPEEKAKEIYSKYTDALNIRDLRPTANPFAKQCALICCDEILEEIKSIPDQDGYIEFWTEVKTQIEKL